MCGAPWTSRLGSPPSFSITGSQCAVSGCQGCPWLPPAPGRGSSSGKMVIAWPRSRSWPSKTKMAAGRQIISSSVDLVILFLNHFFSFYENCIYRMEGSVLLVPSYPAMRAERSVTAPGTGGSYDTSTVSFLVSRAVRCRSECF